MRVQIGDCTLYHGDCRDVLPTLQGVDAVVTDPPYGIGAASTAAVVACRSNKAKVRVYDVSDWDNEPVSEDLLALVLASAQWQILFGGNYYSMPPSPCWLVWDKHGTGEFAACELAWTNLKKSIRKIDHMWMGFWRKGNEEKGFHPTQKPLEVMKWCIEQLPSGAQTILDPFMGSGTTGVACVKLGRKFIGIEREPKYFDIASRRIEDAYKQGDLFVAPPAKATNAELEF